MRGGVEAEGGGCPGSRSALRVRSDVVYMECDVGSRNEEWVLRRTERMERSDMWFAQGCGLNGFNNNG